jgi:hypothetical protein
MLRAESTPAASVAAAMKQLALLATLFVLGACQAQGDHDDFRSLRWGVINSSADFIGWLSSPAAPAILEPDDIFAQWPASVYVTQPDIDAAGSGEWGIELGTTGVVAAPISGPVRYTGPDCTGHAHGWIAVYKVDGQPVPAQHCTDQQLSLLHAQGLIFWRYPTEAKFNATMDERWPYARGQLVRSAAGDSYLIPRDQAWGEMLITKSIAGPLGACANLITDAYGCSVRLLDAPGWVPPSPSQVYSLVELEDAP